MATLLLGFVDMNAVLNLICQGGDWRWTVGIDHPNVTIKSEKWDYKSRRTARKAAVDCISRFGLRVDRVLINGT
jgi:hypothetical protein